MCAEARARGGGEVGSLDGDAQAHVVPIGDEDVAGAVRRVTDRQDGEAPAEERMRGIDYLDLTGRLSGRVLEQGSLLPGRSTLWIMAICELFSDFGCVTGCCCA